MCGMLVHAKGLTKIDHILRVFDLYVRIRLASRDVPGLHVTSASSSGHTNTVPASA